MPHPYRMRSTRKGNETELQRRQRELADDVAATDIQSTGFMHKGEGDDALEQVRNAWYSRPHDPEDAGYFDRACVYLRLRGLLQEHPTRDGLVRPNMEAMR